jgi:PadR family transcriptional regulator AphA
MELSPTAYVILGMLQSTPKSGYEIKQVVDHSTRFFWTASYGQIYPDLKRLAKEGLVEGTSSPQGGRKRTVYRITAAGRTELRDWLRRPPETFELREEGLLKLFFAGALPTEEAVEIVREMRRYRLGLVEQLREIEPKAQATGGYPLLVLRGGIEYNQWFADWCQRMEKQILSETGREERSA